MGLDLNAFGAGFFGKAVKDREAQSEEERLARRQALVMKLQEESADRQAAKKIKKGTAYKQGDAYMVQDEDDWGRPNGAPRPARPDEIREYEAGDLDLRSKKAGTAAAEFNASTMEEDRDLGIQERRQRMAIDREQNARGWAAENRMSNESKESKAAAKKDSKEQEQGVKDARQALADVASIPVTDPHDPQVRKMYDEINLLMATKPIGFRSRIKMIQAQAKRLASTRSKDDSGDSGLAPLDPNL